MRTLPLILLLALLAPVVSGQSIPQGDKEPAWVMLGDSLVGGLVLDTAQRRQLMDVELRYERSFDDVMANDTLDDAGIRSQLQQLDAQREKEIQGVMTAEQYAQWQQMTAHTRRSRNMP